MELAKFLKENPKNENGSTHTRIGSKEFNIFGGAYYIDIDKDEKFYNLYYDWVFKNKKQEYLTEKQYDNGVICIDLDFNFSPDVELRLHTEEHIQTIIQSYCNCLKKYFDFKQNDTFEIFVLEKSNVNMLDNKTKDGIHIIIGLCLERKYQIDLRDEIMKNEDILNILDQLPLINKIDDVFDNAISSGRNNWQMFGSRKPANKAYELTYHYKVEYDNGFMIETQEINEIDFDLFKRLSIRNLNRPIINLNENIALCNENKIIKSVIQTEITEIEKYIKLGIKYGMFKKMKGYSNWINIGFIIKNQLGENGENLFVDISKDDEKFEENFVRTTYKGLLKDKPDEKKPLTIATLIKMYKDVDKDLTKKIIKEFKNPPIEKKDIDLPKIDAELKPIFDEIEKVLELSTETQLAKFFIYLTENNYKCVDGKNKKFYVYENNIWREIDGGHHLRNNITEVLSKNFKLYYNYYFDFLKTIDNTYSIYDEIIKKTNKIQDLIVLVGKTSWKTNIFTELSSLTYDENFEKIINRKKNYLPVKNGLFNMITNQLEERTKEDLFTYNCDVNYIPYDETNEDFIFIDTYMNDLFCNNQETKNCVIDLLKSWVSGNTLRYITFFIGNGRNGKSLFMKQITLTFSGCVDTIDKKVIVKQKGNEANCNTHIEKLAKNRIGFLSELTNGDELNDVPCKQITGGDPMNFRGLFKGDATIQPTINAVCSTNIMLKYNGGDSAVADRLIQVPFNNKFDIDDSFPNKVLSKKDFFFSYIMNKGTIRDKFNFSEEMKLSKQETMDDNIDTLKEFIDTKMIACINDKNNKPIKIDFFRQQYNKWLKENGHQVDIRHKSSFTKAIRNYGIETKETHSIRRLLNVRFRYDEEEDDEEIKENENQTSTTEN